jgi:hypothetical protein
MYARAQEAAILTKKYAMPISDVKWLCSLKYEFFRFL